MPSSDADHERGAGPNPDLRATTAPDPDELRARIGERLTAGTDALERDIFASVLTELPAYADLARDPEQAQELRASIRRVVEMFVGLVHDPAMLSEEILELLHGVGTEVGRLRAGQGMPLTDVQRLAHIALRIGLRRLHSEVKGMGLTEVAFDTTTAITEVFHEYVHAFNQGVSAGFFEIQQRAATDRAEERSALLGQLLDGALETREALHEVVSELGGDALAPSTLLVVAPSGSDGSRSLTGPVSVLLRNLDGSLRGPLRSAPVPHTPILLPDDDETPVDGTLRRVHDVATFSNVVVAVERVPRTAELSPTYTWLVDLLAVPANRRAPGLVEVEHLVPAWLVDATPAGSDFRFLDWSLGPVLRAGPEARQRLLEAARAHLDAQGVNKHAAELLGVDPRTASQRRHELEALTRLSLDDADHRRILDYALLLLDLRRATLPAPGADAWRLEPG